MTSVETTRFAPSPTGRLHLGHALAALFAAREAGPHGTFLVRIEDIDLGRCREAFVAGIFEDLRWLGLAWPEPVWRQSHRFAAYAGALADLRARGLVYPCFCSRADIAREIAASAAAPQGPDGPLYPGTCRGLPHAEAERRIAAGEPHAWRLDVARALAGTPTLRWRDRDAGERTATPEIFGDAVLARRDTPTSYHLAVTVDDAAQGVTCVTRAADLAPATHLHRLLQHLLGLPTPEYRFHPLLTDGAGKRLAKRDNAPALADLRAAGASRADIRAMLGWDG
ncbi:Glutamyl-Q tRNA(Asp) synthetase [uncultured Alphaproteobacteria bacterium]|uniref:Glutamyl-Q tRNA(Asp) synthetase n=1 Tax=uncultured Alphaproteobacteria bacterium TaxID=91750 RepID=A0A212KII0_9PROT|nr:Glutamyl-Q tRNA(Asp) synthetase [uncultured Alphaproteobacteria bacterium]